MDKVIEMYTIDNMSLRAIALKVGKDRGTIKRYLIKNGIEIVRKPRSDRDTSGVTQEKKLYYNYKRGAERRNIEFTLSFELFKELIYMDCHYCGCKPYRKFSNDAVREYAFYIIVNGIDRIDNEKGYIEGNVTSCCGCCNTMKSKLSVEDFLDKIKRIYENIKLNEVKLNG